MEPGSFRAGDADRKRVAERLRIALEEGRLNLDEYDERLREAFAAKTYAELDALLADIPGTAPLSQSQVVLAGTGAPAPRWRTGPDGRYPDATRRWLAEQVGSWFGVVVLCTAIWAATSVLSGEVGYFWPGWVAGPWGALVVLNTLSGLLRDEPQRWAAKQARKDAERDVRRRAKKDDEAEQP